MGVVRILARVTKWAFRIAQTALNVGEYATQSTPFPVRITSLIAVYLGRGSIHLIEYAMDTYVDHVDPY